MLREVVVTKCRVAAAVAETFTTFNYRTSSLLYYYCKKICPVQANMYVDYPFAVIFASFDLNYLSGVVALAAAVILAPIPFLNVSQYIIQINMISNTLHIRPVLHQYLCHLEHRWA
jgi:hypothetical protein